MARKLKVLVACGSGVATSTIAEVPDKQANVDVVFTTANYRKPPDKPHLSVFGLVSGVNEAAAKKKSR